MKKILWLAVISLLVCVCAFSACDESNDPQTPTNDHVHAFEEWTTIKKASCATDGVNERYCSCGEKQTQTIEALGHEEIIDAAVAATCTTEGKTEGKHCSLCHETLVAQTTIDKLGHTEVVDAAVAATCTTEGKTEGTHCRNCSVVLVSQTVISSLGHTYDDGEITTQATCNQSGVKTFTCTVDTCRHSYTETYSLPAYTATELYALSVAYVGEIVTYDQRGNALSLATGFVISSDGKIVTNYHVIEGAYSADITIDKETYTIASVLAYDENIDLAVLKVDATGLTAATICKNPVSAGSTVYAIGSSRGMTNTYSQGIITYADRVVDGVSHVQHDASITHGNSGGPLINVYGEVIGINTWGISDSQNLNFAVFTAELDNLTYESPLTLEEVYLKESGVFERIKKYIMDNGTYDASDNSYRLTLGTSYSSDGSSKYTRLAYYYVEYNEITLDFLIDDGVFWAYFLIDENVDGSYVWSYFDDSDYEMSGTLYAATFDSDTLLGYSSSNISSSSLRQSVRELASIMISVLCSWIDSDFDAIRVSAGDLGFYYY